MSREDKATPPHSDDPKQCPWCGSTVMTPEQQKEVLRLLREFDERKMAADAEKEAVRERKKHLRLHARKSTRVRHK